MGSKSSPHALEAPRSKCSTPGCPRPCERDATLCRGCAAALENPRVDGWETFAARRYRIGADGERL